MQSPRWSNERVRERDGKVESGDDRPLEARGLGVVNGKRRRKPGRIRLMLL